MAVKTDFLFTIHFLLFVPLLLFDSKVAFSQTDYYIPKALIIPVHTHKQELHTSLGISGGYDVNLSFALTNHLSVFTTGTLNTGTYRRKSLFGDRFDIEKNDHVVKGGVGYFSTTNHRLINVIESYAGYGSYKVDNYWYFVGEKGKSGYKTRASYWNVFWQLQATHKIERHEFTGALRLAYNKFNSLQYKDVSYTEHVKTTLDGLWGLTMDPAISYSYLVKNLKFNLQVGGSASLNAPVTLDEMYYRKEGNQIVATKPPGITKIGIGALIGRLSIQYNFDFRKK